MCTSARRPPRCIRSASDHPASAPKTNWRRYLSNATPGPDGWIRAVGYHESVAGDLDRTALDAVVPHIPVRIQHRSGALWILNTAALGRVGLPEHPDGRLRSADRGWSEALARRETDLAELSRRITATGVTGVTDATPDLDADDMVALMVAHRRGEFRPRPHFLAPGKKILHDDRLDLDALIGLDHLAAQRRSAGGGALRHRGPTRRDHRGPARRRQPSARSHRARRAGARRRPATTWPSLGLTVVTQPNFVAERGDQYLTDVPAAEHRQLWRVASLLKAAVPVALSTDMPFGHGDPWTAMRAAVHRTTLSGAVLNARRMCLGANGFDDVSGPAGSAGPGRGPSHPGSPGTCAC